MDIYDAINTIGSSLAKLVARNTVGAIILQPRRATDAATTLLLYPGATETDRPMSSVLCPSFCVCLTDVVRVQVRVR